VTRRALPGQRQRGAALLIAVLIIFSIAVFGAVIASSMSASDITDTAAQGGSIEAHFAAETGIERALKQFASGAAACGSLDSGGPITVVSGRSFTTTDFTTGFDGAALPPGQCRVQVVGTVAGTNVSRTMQAVLDRNLLAAENPGFNDPAGTGMPSNWTATDWDYTGGSDPATSAPANCTRAAYAVKARDNTVGSNTGTVTINPPFQVTGATTLTVRFNYRVVRIGSASTAIATACNTAPTGTACAGTAGDAQFCFTVTGSSTWTSTTVTVPMDTSSAALSATSITAACTPTTQLAPAAYASCDDFYQGGSATKATATISIPAATTISALTFNIYLRAGTSAANRRAREAWLDNIELISNEGKLIARTAEWRDCAVTTCP
jgi:hypothetical protein